MASAVLFLVLIWAAPGQSSGPSEGALVGCLTRSPRGTLQLEALPSKKVYSIQGDTKALTTHVDQIIRTLGRTGAPGNQGTSVFTLTSNSVQVIAESCAAGLPGPKTEAVGGKVGEDQIAVPTTTTASSAETTPGFQTEAGTNQLIGKSAQALRSGVRPPVPYAPFKPEQVAQSELAADVNAAAALRAEILPGNALGVNGSMPSPPGNSTKTNSQKGSASTIPSSRK